MSHRYPAPLIMWTWQDLQVEQPDVRYDALVDIADHGFAGALAMLRGCRYAVSDPLVVEAARTAADQAHQLGLAFWFALDPRLDQGRLIGLPGGRASYLLTNRSAAALPCETTIQPDGRYRVRLEYGPPRTQHMLSQVAIRLEPASIQSVIAYRKGPDGTVEVGSVRDLTGDARLFVQRAAEYVEVFGRVSPPPSAGWYVLALVRCGSSYPELGSDHVIDAVCATYRSYHRAGVELDGVFWDEIGYVTGFGSDRSRLPIGPAVGAAFLARHGAPLSSRLPYLLLDDDGGHAPRVRRDYYAAVQDVVLAAQLRCREQAEQLWGAGTDSGIHQTWHQNADDLPHGTGDWWRGSTALSGGFTDVGDAERADDEDHLAEMLSMVAISASLARHHDHPQAFCNMWGVDYGSEAVDWWVHLLSVFGVAWIAHLYGSTGYIDCDTGWGPGYPDHPTWATCAVANRRLERVHRITGGVLPEADVAVVYPIETLAGVGGPKANLLAREAQHVVARMVRAGLAVDVLSPALFASGRLREGSLEMRTPRGSRRYTAVVYPHPQVLHPAEAVLLDRLRAAAVPSVLLGLTPTHTIDGADLPPRSPLPPVTPTAVDAALSALPRLVVSPDGALAGLFLRPDGTCTVLVTPARPGDRVSGVVTTGDLTFEVARLGGIAAVRFTPDGRLVEQWAHEGRVSWPEVVG